MEGRQAVRELLLAGRRKVREVWVATGDGERGPSEIVALAADLRVPVQEVSRKRLDAEARSEAPQGVLARAAPLQEADLDDLVKRRSGPKGVPPRARGRCHRPREPRGDPAFGGRRRRNRRRPPRHRAVHITPTVAKAAAGAIEHVPIAVVSVRPTAIERLRKAASGS